MRKSAYLHQGSHIPASGEGGDVDERLRCMHDSEGQHRDNLHNGMWDLRCHSCCRLGHRHNHLSLRDVTSHGEREDDLSTTLIEDGPTLE